MVYGCVRGVYRVRWVFFFFFFFGWGGRWCQLFAVTRAFGAARKTINQCWLPPLPNLFSENHQGKAAHPVSLMLKLRVFFPLGIFSLVLSPPFNN